MDKVESGSNIIFDKDIEDEAVNLAAYDIMKVLCNEEMINHAELRAIHDKYNILVD